MNFEKEQLELPGMRQRPQFWKIPSLRRCRELWSERRFKQDWDETITDWQATED